MAHDHDTPLADRAQQVHRLSDELGFAIVGIAPAEPAQHADTLRQWIEQGKHGQMHYLAKHLDVRLDAGKLLEGARSVICVADAYPDTLTTHPESHQPTSHVGRIARYAWGDDYHHTIKRRLFELADALRTHWPDERFRCAVDTAPVLEREHAQRAGLGWAGKHTLLIHPVHGSWTLLGLIITTLRLQDSAEAGYPQKTVPPTDHCGTCTRCIDACPTRCIDPQGYSLDASRCISYLTLEHRTAIDPALHRTMGDWIAGCDVCQEVCPHNQPPQRQSPPIHRAYQPRPPAPGLNLLDVLGWSAQDRKKAFARSALKRIKLDMLKRNALIAAGNALLHHDAPELRQRIEQIASDEHEHEIVRVTAKQVLDRLTTAQVES